MLVILRSGLMGDNVNNCHPVSMAFVFVSPPFRILASPTLIPDLLYERAIDHVGDSSYEIHWSIQ